jgi:hypothetical protein
MSLGRMAHAGLSRPAAKRVAQKLQASFPSTPIEVRELILDEMQGKALVLYVCDGLGVKRFGMIHFEGDSGA